MNKKISELVELLVAANEDVFPVVDVSTGETKKIQAQNLPGGGTDWGDIGGTLADQTDLQNALDAKLNKDFSGFTAKTTPVDDDTVAINDSAAAGAVKSLSWANIKATLKTYFDTLYASLTSFNDHSARHENGGADEISVTGLSGLLADSQTPTAHATSHQNGGADEISVAGLSGLLADAQTPLGHDNTKHDTDLVGEAGVIAAMTAKSTPVNADVFVIEDSAASNAPKKTTFQNVKETIIAAIQAASSTVSGIVELAIGSEVTAADSTRAVTGRALADSDFGKRVIQVAVTDPQGNALTTGDGKAYIRINSVLNGYNLVGVAAQVSTVSSSGIPTVQIANVTQAADMLSTKLTIDQSETDSKDATTPAVIDTANDDVATGDQLRIDVDVAGTGTKGLVVELTFQLP